MALEMYKAIPSTAADPAFGLTAKAYSIQYLEALYARPGAWKHMRNFTADCSAFGETVGIPSFPRLTATDVTPETGSFAYDSTSVLPQTVTIDKLKAVAYSVPETVILQSKLDVKAAFAKEAAKAVTDAIDASMSALVASATTNTVGTYSADLTEAYCLGALGKLVGNFANLSNPDDLCWILPTSQFGITHAFKAYASNFRIMAGNTDTEGGNDVRAMMDTLYGINVYWRNDTAMIVTATHHGGLFYRDSVGVAIQRNISMRQPMPIPGTINTELLTYCMYGVNTIKETLMCKVFCK